MKITNTLLLVAVAGTLAACEKTSTDTATPADATPTAPAVDDAIPGEEEAPAEEAAEEAPAEEAPAEEAAEEPAE